MVMKWTILLGTTAVCCSFSSIDVTSSRQHSPQFPSGNDRRHSCTHLFDRSALVCAMAKRIPRTEIEQGASPRPIQSRPARGGGRNSTFIPQRAPHQFDHRQEQARPFINVASEIQTQQPNEDAPLLTLPSDNGQAIRRIERPHIVTYSLNDLFPGLQLSELFASSTDFRNAIRDSIRVDMFDTTPTYHNLSEKARRVLLLPDTSLQSSWPCRTRPGQAQLWAREPVTGDVAAPTAATEANTASNGRMTRLSNVLREFLGSAAPTGDDFMDTIGSLCTTTAAAGSTETTALSHWMDIVGVLNRRVPHSWHQDTGRSPDDCQTVLLGFPPTNHYDGVGVFSHVIKLSHEQWTSSDATFNDPSRPLASSLDQPRVYTDQELQAAVTAMQDNEPLTTLDTETSSLEPFIVRPRFAMGREIIAYRDVDVLHSSPDVAYRTSLMRFM